MSITWRVLNNIVGQGWFERQRSTLSLIGYDPKATLLDLGCGDGELTLKIAQKSGTKSVYGIDIMAKNVDGARAKGIDARKSDLEQKLPFENETFDVVNAADIIEHLTNTDNFLREIHRVLRVGGYVVIMTPNLAALHNIFYLVFGKQPNCACVSDEVYAGTWQLSGNQHIHHDGKGLHLRIFTLSALEELLNYHGFQVERSIGSVFQPFPIPLARVMCFIDKRHATSIIVKARKKEHVQDSYHSEKSRKLLPKNW